MSETATKLLDQLLQLPEPERVMIADRLWESLGDEAKQQILGETTADPEFQAELERRLKEVEEHPERLLDGEQVMAELRERLRRKQGS
jgi:putative addiction module component (TIGR02574 family)